jgi:hypothetical protein
MKNQHHKELEIVVAAMVTIYKMLKATGVRDHTGNNLQFLYNKNTSLSGDQLEARQLMDQTINTITSKNPHISNVLVYDRLLFKVVQQALFFTGDKHDIKSEIEQGTEELLNYHPRRDIDIPIVYLDIGPEPVKFGLATFYKMTDEDRDEVWLKSIKADSKEFLMCYARINAIGDSLKSKDDADRVANDMLTYLRAVGFPISVEPQIQFGVMNDYPPSQLRPYRSGRPLGANRLEGDANYSWKLGPGLVSYDIQELLSAIEPTTLEKLKILIESDYREPSTNMRSKFLLGLHWLGESTKPDSIEARFAKLAISLEAFIGGESKQDILSTRGLTAALAERGAFVAEDNVTNRKQVHDAIIKYYGYRSGIVHGGKKQISEQDLIDFSSLVRKIAWALLLKIDNFKDIDRLQEWIIDQRYS